MSAEPEVGDERIDYAKLATLGALQMAQFFPAAFTAIALPAIFRTQGLPLEMFWLLALPGIPRWFKWLLALLVDNYGSAKFGYRKSWIVPSTTIGALSYLCLSLVTPAIETIYLVVGILTISSLIMAAQDIAADGYATEGMTDADRTVGTSIIIFMAHVGVVIGGGLMSVVETFGWTATMAIASALLISAALPAIVRPEPPPPIASQQRHERGERPDLIHSLTRPDSRYILPFVYLFGFSGSLFFVMVSVFLVDKGFSLTEIGVMVPAASFIGAGTGAFVTPVLVRRWGLRGAGVVGLFTIPIEGIVFAWLAASGGMPSIAVMTAALAVVSFTSSIYAFVVNNSRFRWPSKAQAATDFSLQSSIWNGGGWTAGTVAGFLAAWLGWTGFFLFVAVVGIISAGTYVLMFDRVEQLVRIREESENKFE